MKVDKSAKWRVAILVTTLIMGGALVVTGIIEYRASFKIGKAITRAQIMSLMMGVRREFKKTQAPKREVFLDIFEMLKEHGVTYAAIINRNNRTVASKGTARVPFSLESRSLAKSRQSIHVRFVKSTAVSQSVLAHAVLRFGPPPGGHGRRRGHFIQLEIIPKQANALISRSFWVMIIDIAAALTLVFAATIFWRLSQSAQAKTRQMNQQLAKDKELKTLGQMSAILGHELRNPIASLKGHAQLLVENIPAEHPAHRQSEIIAQESVYLEMLTNQILDFAKSGDLKLEKVYLDDLAAGVIALCDAQPVNLKIKPNLAPVKLDRNRMEQVLVNILNNARRADPSGSPIEFNVDIHDQLIFEIIDDGPGIPNGENLKIFEPFYSLQAKGTGLGLYLAKRIVTAHGGKITADNCPAKGARFTLTLPKPTEAQKAEETQNPVETQKPVETQHDR